METLTNRGFAVVPTFEYDGSSIINFYFINCGSSRILQINLIL
ncbi:hypothetical protein LEP1GSC041_2876 [Leptospira noguchii str. 2006001870]|uniref:Uncharacterized protein n=1 Tax=Leptospira noguchii serovar Autumnalis str. ZUN142 TaxID=1085540 RepID=M6U7Y7_9LEPT|nr:hypothetical protein LEP1GSC041_2876 [Leptospira noguchii str. 2006001870]EMO27350.1 hypothetical protein LEP1GSC170_6275 [Leptospira interrogans serovar Bataviae str. HAI135]EMO39041.1 hypothetical protein LEP1GSC186_3654 [Leptospira noguchii serovar Autumnalis str. ZUN142]